MVSLSCWLFNSTTHRRTVSETRPTCPAWSCAPAGAPPSETLLARAAPAPPHHGSDRAPPSAAGRSAPPSRLVHRSYEHHDGATATVARGRFPPWPCPP